MANTDAFTYVYELLLDHFGYQGWWPGETPFEIAVGAVLTQNTNWQNVAKAIDNLKVMNWLSYEALAVAPMEELAEAIRPSGYYNLKARRLKNLLAMISREYDGELSFLLSDKTESARHNLLSVKGVGPETADAILLYAGNHPVFVIDTYTHRVFSRHGLFPEESDYHEMQQEFIDRLPNDHQLFNEYHALIVMVSKEYCKKKNPLCEACPLKGVNNYPA
ncbi:endonuclease III domain-containing protein [Desulfopila sp. IMCC35008]|uniref:endonuclease III domain-containing protein n=1 Tax=Desulfopila sp. IMCC35008 TaxID=2653858 RepID=UPI0013D62300|nr:endonuclease III domain-containing protein [Desulfopila sp. IMCC35008]